MGGSYIKHGKITKPIYIIYVIISIFIIISFQSYSLFPRRIQPIPKRTRDKGAWGSNHMSRFKCIDRHKKVGFQPPDPTLDPPLWLLSHSCFSILQGFLSLSTQFTSIFFTPYSSVYNDWLQECNVLVLWTIHDRILVWFLLWNPH